MISIHTNLSSLAVQKNLAQSTKGINTAIERMSTGYKINHAGDNAANYSISQNMNAQLSACDIAADNIAMGMDLLTVAQDTIAGMQDRGSRLHALITQARNGTYGTDSLDAMTREAQALVSEINRLYVNTEYNGIKLFDGVELPEWAQTIKATAGTIDGKSLEQCAAEHNGFIVEVDMATPQVIVTNPDELEDAISTNTKIGIGNAETLAELAKIVNGTDDYTANSCYRKTIILTEDIDLSDYQDGEGWTPIGNNNTNKFKGTFNGNGHKITGLYINRPDASWQGLFGYATGEIKNIGIEGANVTGVSYTGGLAGEASVITNSYVTGNVTGNTVGGNGNIIGGLAGRLDGRITNSYATGDVKGRLNIGGLVGSAAGTIIDSYATGNVTGFDSIGGLVGSATGTITNSYATGNITGQSRTGGLTGMAKKAITSSYATGNVKGQNYIDGLTGMAQNTITNSYATGSVTAGGTTDNDHTYYDNAADLTAFEVKTTSLQVGTHSGEDSQINVDTNLKLNLHITNLTSDYAYNNITDFLNKLSSKATELGAAQNRLESASESNLVQMDNLTSSLSTIRDADISEVSSDFIRQQILQQACATLMSTANQSPAIALQLI